MFDFTQQQIGKQDAPRATNDYGGGIAAPEADNASRNSADEPAGSAVSITLPQNRQVGPLAPEVKEEKKAPCNPENRQSRITGGVDTLELLVFGSWRRWNELKPKLEQAQAKAAETNEPAAIETPEGEPMYVHSNGIKLGNFYAQWPITVGGFKLLIRNDQRFNEKVPSLKAEFGSAILMEQGHVSIVNEMRSILKELGFWYETDRVSRIDICADRPGVNVGQYFELHKRDQRVSRFKEGAYFHGRKFDAAQGFAIGKGSVKLRIYDKLAEVLKNDDQRKLQVLAETRWNGIPECATRVEFQLRRRFLKNTAHVSTFEQVNSKLGDIAAYLMQEWCRFTDVMPDHKNGNQSRAEWHPLWERTYEDFIAWAGPSNQLLPRRKPAKPSMRRLMASARGSITSACAVLSLEVGSLEDAIELLRNEFYRADAKAKKGFREVVAEKRRKLEVARAPRVVIDPSEIPF